MHNPCQSASRSLSSDLPFLMSQATSTESPVLYQPTSVPAEPDVLHFLVEKAGDLPVVHRKG